MNTESKVYIVDDDEAVLKSLELLIGTVGLHAETCRSCSDFLEKYDRSVSGCLVLDVRMPDMSGIELQSRLAQDEIDLPVIFITGHGDVPMAVEAMKRGAADFIEKPFRDQVLLDAIHAALQKASARRDALAGKLVYSRRRETLTDRENEVLNLLLEGRNTKEIATGLGISPKTVDYHRLHILDKMGVETVVELLRMLPAS